MMMQLGFSLITSQPSFPATFLGASCKPKLSKFQMTHSLPSNSKNAISKKSKNPNPMDIMNGGKTHFLPQEKVEIFEFLEGWVEENMLPMLKTVEDSWQPQDFLPDFSSEGFSEDLNELQERAMEIPDEFYVCLVGNMIAEEALPTYSAFLNSLDGVRDDESGGASMKSWARWRRGWSAEENRHGDLLNKYLYLCGRIDMRQIEKTIHYLIASGMDFRTETNPFLAFIYTSFQERATFLAHTNLARQAKMHGDTTLAKICSTIAADEKRHEIAYTKIIERLFEIDPNTTMLSMGEMMHKRISMPVRILYDGKDHNLAIHLSMVNQKTGSYTVKDYGDVLDFFIKRWCVEEITGLSDKGRQAQEYVCGLSAKIRRLEERIQEISFSENTSKMLSFSWIFNKEVGV